MWCECDTGHGVHLQSGTGGGGGGDPLLSYSDVTVLSRGTGGQGVHLQSGTGGGEGRERGWGGGEGVIPYCAQSRPMATLQWLLQCLLFQLPGVIGSVLGLVGPVFFFYTATV